MFTPLVPEPSGPSSSAASAVGLLSVHRSEEGTYRVGDCAGGPPRQVMAGAVDRAGDERPAVTERDGERSRPGPECLAGRLGRALAPRPMGGHVPARRARAAWRAAPSRNVRQSAPRASALWPQTCQFTCSSGRRLRPARAAPRRAGHARATVSASTPPGRTVVRWQVRPAPCPLRSRTPVRRSRAGPPPPPAPGPGSPPISATPPPNECPTSTARSMPRTSRSSMTARALAANPPAGSGLEPYPGRSAATAWSCAGSRSAT